MADGKKIFIVEDENRIARFLQMELEHEGFETETESNGSRAYERIIQGDFDLVLLDVMLPDMDGLTICKKVRELSDVPIIMLTARDDVNDKVQGLDIGAEGVGGKLCGRVGVDAQLAQLCQTLPSDYFLFTQF